MSLFGSSTTPAATSTPLFGTTPAKPATGGLFGSSSTPTATATSSVPLFGTTNTANTTASTGSGGLFGAKPATPAASGSLFGGSTAPAASTGGGLFGSTTTAPAASTGGGGLFGSSTTSTASGGLFGSTTSTTTSGGGGLFGATKPATTSGGLFGSTSTTSAPATSFGTAPATTNALGLGGIQQQSIGGTTTTTGGTTTSSAPGALDKDVTKENEWQQTQTLIRDMLPLIEDRLKKNRDVMDESETMSVDCVAIEEMIEKARGLIGDVRRDVFNATTASEGVAQLVAHDKQQANMAKRVQEQASTANQTMHADAIKQHLVERIHLYDLEMRALQERVNFMRSRFDKLLKGEPSLTMTELDNYFLRCDSTVSSADFHIEQLGKDIEEVRDLLIEQGYTQLRKWNATTLNNVDPVSAVSEGAEFFPSQSSLAIIGSALRAPATAPTASTGGLGLGGGSSLFGNTGTTSLFGSTTTKPAFSGGSLFGSSTTNTSTAPTTTSATTSLFGSKPTTTTTSTPFGSTLSNNSSGTLFSSKK
ncbi:unnamed protein product [Caenorhabditis nigoni]